MRIIVAPAMRSKFKYYQQKGLAEFFNTIRPIEPIPAGISKGRCGGMNTSSRREAERPFWVSKAALCCPTVRLSSLLGQALRQNDSFAN